MIKCHAAQAIDSWVLMYSAIYGPLPKSMENENVRVTRTAAWIEGLGSDNRAPHYSDRRSGKEPGS